MSEDLGYDELDDETPDQDQQGDNSAIKSIRKAARESAARAKAAEAEVAELKLYKEAQEASIRKAQLASVAVSLGLRAGQATLVPSDIEPTPEAVGAWAVAHELLAVESAPVEAAPVSFVPVTGAGGVAPDLSISYEAWQAMYANEATRAQAEKLYAAGRVTGFEPGNDDGSADVSHW
jgi:hypothetical protein